MKRAAALLSLLGLTLAACGSSGPTPAGTPAVTIQLTAQNIAFDKASFTVPADVTFAVELNNQDAAPHDVDISGNGISRQTEPFSGPATKTFVYAGLPAGTYTFVCSVHTEMNGTVVSGAP